MLSILFIYNFNTIIQKNRIIFFNYIIFPKYCSYKLTNLFVFNVLYFSLSNIEICLDWITFRKLYFICIYNYIILFYPIIFLTFIGNHILLIIRSICITIFVIFSANLNQNKPVFAKIAYNTFIFNSTSIILKIRITFLHYTNRFKSIFCFIFKNIFIYFDNHISLRQQIQMIFFKSCIFMKYGYISHWK